MRCVPSCGFAVEPRKPITSRLPVMECRALNSRTPLEAPANAPVLRLRLGLSGGGRAGGGGESAEAKRSGSGGRAGEEALAADGRRIGGGGVVLRPGHGFHPTKMRNTWEWGGVRRMGNPRWGVCRVTPRGRPEEVCGTTVRWFPRLRHGNELF